MQYTTITQALFNKAKTSPLEDELVYDTFLNHAFPVYDIGRILKKYLENAGIDINNATAIRTFARSKGFSGATLFNATQNEAYINRNQAIHLCFCFNLNLTEANEFLKEMRHCAFHYRSFDDLIYAYYLSHNGNFTEANEKIEEYTQKYNHHPNDDKNINYAKQATPNLITRPDFQERTYTQFLAEEVEKSGFNLMDWLDNKGGNVLSALNMTATIRYQELVSEIYNELNSLRNIFPNEDFYKNLIEYISYNDISHLISSDTHPRIHAQFKDILGKISAFLRDNANLSILLNYLSQVTRNNLLIVLLLHLETFEYVDWQKEWKDNETIQRIKTQNEYCFDNAVEYINNDLEMCGFPPLHPRVPLDYLILSSLAGEIPHETFTTVWKNTIQE